MSIYEYNEEYAMRVTYVEEYQRVKAQNMQTD